MSSIKSRVVPCSPNYEAATRRETARFHFRKNLETGNGADKALGSFDGIQPARGAESGADINARGSQTRAHIGTRRIDIGDQLDAGRDRRCHNLRGSLLRPAFRFTSDLSSVASSMA